MRGNKKTIYILIFLVGLLIGYLSTQWSYFTIDKNINPIDSIGIIVNIFLVVFISNALEKRKTENRVEKDIIIDKLKNIGLVSGKIIIVDNKFRFSSATSIFKDLSTEISALKTMINYTGLRFNENKIMELRSRYLEFKTIITGQVVHNDELQFEEINKNKSIIIGRKLKEIIYELIIDCNKL